MSESVSWDHVTFIDGCFLLTGMLNINFDIFWANVCQFCGNESIKLFLHGTVLVLQKNNHEHINCSNQLLSEVEQTFRFMYRVRNLKFATYLKFATCENTNKINELW